MTATKKANAFIPVVQASAGLRAFECEITGEEISMPDCLSCAQKGAPGCPAFPALVHQIVNDPRPHDFSQQLAREQGADFGISVTESIYCPRKFRLSMENNWTEKPTDFYARVMGTATHALLEGYDHQGIAEERMMVRFPFLGSEILFSGKPDLVTYDPKKGWLITDYKRSAWPPRPSYSYTCPTCGATILDGITDRRGLKFYCEACDDHLKRAQVTQIKHLPEAKSAHQMQINLLAMLLERNEEQYGAILKEKFGIQVDPTKPPAFSGQIIYLGPSSVVRVPVDVDISLGRKFLGDRLRTILSAELPPAEPLESWECKYCKVKDACELAAAAE